MNLYQQKEKHHLVHLSESRLWGSGKQITYCRKSNELYVDLRSSQNQTLVISDCWMHSWNKLLADFLHWLQTVAWEIMWYQEQAEAPRSHSIHQNSTKINTTF